MSKYRNLKTFWDKLGLGKLGWWQKTKWVISTLIFIIPNLIFYCICRIGEYSEKIYFGSFMPYILRWIKK